VRVAAAGALGQIGGDEAISSLELAVKDEDPWVRGAAVKALARVGGDRAMAAVLSVSANADGMLMLSVLEAMDSLGGQKALELVKTALAHSDEEVVKLAIEILARHDDTWIDTYRDKLLGHSHWDVRNSFIRALVARRGTKAVPHLREALQHEGDDMVRALIQEQLDRLQ
jgi:HEAT repeat protein